MPSIITDRFSVRVFPLFIVACLFIASDAARCAEPWPSTGPGIGPAYEKIQAALDNDARFDFIDTPLDQVVAFLEDQQDIPIELDAIALDDVGIGTDAPITGCIKGISLGSALQILLGQLDLTYAIESEVLMITTPEKAALRPEIRVYNVAALLGDDMDTNSLAMTLYQVLQPDFGGGFGGPGGMMGYGAAGGMGGSMGGVYGGGGPPPGAAPVPAVPVPRIIPYKQLLIVRHTTTGQNDIARLLGAMAAAMDEKDE